MLSRRLILAVLVILVAGLTVTPALTQDDLMGDFTVSHYFGGFGGEFIDGIVDAFIAENPGLMHAASPGRSRTIQDIDSGAAGRRQPTGYLQLLGGRAHSVCREWRPLAAD